MSQIPKFAIIIPHYNDLTRLLRCLEALMPQMRDDVELVVVDNKSTDDLTLLHQKYPDLRLVTEPKKGAAEARNRGVAETHAPVLFFLDCDCVPSDTWLETACTLHANADVIGGEITVFDETPAPRSGPEAFEAVFAFDNRSYVETKGFSVTANLLTRRDVFEATGPFVAGLSEDLDWCRRATQAGHTLIYDGKLTVSHPSRSDWPALKRKWRRVTQESFALLPQTVPARLRWFIRSLLMIVSAAVHSPRVLQSQKLSGIERWRGLATLWRQRLQRSLWMMQQAILGRL